MIGIWSEHAATYLFIVAGVTFVAFTAPLIFTPLFWARLLGWRIPEHAHLAIYLGRSLGVVALALNAAAWRAAQSGEGLTTIFFLIFALSALMVPLHIWGWARKIQPVSESVEIFLWTGLALLTLAFWPAG